MTDTPDGLSYAERFTRAAEQCRDAAAKCRAVADQAEVLRMSIRNLGSLHAIDPDDYDRRHPLLLSQPSVPTPAAHIDSLNQLTFALHGQASIWDAEAQYYDDCRPEDTKEPA